jgi:peptidoglycan/LPS O-acetylase OafA/YrhL
MVNAWGLKNPVLGWDFPAWSVSAEWFAYLLFYRLASRYVALVGAAACIGAHVVFTDSWHLNGPIERITCDFLCGMFLHRVYETRTSGHLWQWIAPLGLSAAPFILWFTSGITEGYLLIADSAVVVLGLAVSQGLIAKILGGSVMVFLGEVSYSLYMTHGLVFVFQEHALSIATHVHSSLVTRTGLVVFYSMLIFASAVATYLIVEKPARHWIRARIRAPELRIGV